MTRQLATHSKRLRWSARLGCGCWALAGERVSYYPGRGWVCRGCSGLDELMRQPPRPSERDGNAAC